MMYKMCCMTVDLLVLHDKAGFECQTNHVSIENVQKVSALYIVSILYRSFISWQNLWSRKKVEISRSAHCPTHLYLVPK